MKYSSKRTCTLTLLVLANNTINIGSGKFSRPVLLGFLHTTFS